LLGGYLHPCAAATCCLCSTPRTHTRPRAFTRPRPRPRPRPRLQGVCAEGDCKDGEGLLEFADGERYQGQWRAGKKQGVGSYVYVTGARCGGRRCSLGLGRAPPPATDEHRYRCMCCVCCVCCMCCCAAFAVCAACSTLRVLCLLCVPTVPCRVRDECCRYEGQWDLTLMHGEGVYHFPEGHRYEVEEEGAGQ
jgi:hypothetical protein